MNIHKASIYSRFMALLVVAGASLYAPQAKAQAGCFAASPLAAMTITSNFGYRFHPVLKIRKLHGGTDFRAAVGTPMRAVENGIIRYSGWMHGGGNTIEILTDRGVVVRYMHGSKLISQLGDRVTPGQRIADSGNTGEWTNGPHLHFITLVNGSTPVDPVQFLCPAPGSVANAGPEPQQAGETTAPNTPVVAGTAPAGVGGTAAPPMASFPSMSGVSFKDFMAAETGKRFLNPAWYRELINPADATIDNPNIPGPHDNAIVDPTIHMLRELNTMMALRNMLALEQRDAREGIEARLAALLSLDAKEYGERVLSMVRATTTSRR